MAFTTLSHFKDNLISDIEGRIGYQFKNRSLLIQAFCRSSYSEDKNNELLEFFGDTALGLVIVKKMAESYTCLDMEEETFEMIKKNASEANHIVINHLTGEYTEGEMTEIKKRLVCTGSLSAAIDRLGLHKYLVMSKGDVKEGVESQPHVKEDLFEAIVGAVAIDSMWNNDALVCVVDAMLSPDEAIKDGYEFEEDYEKLAQEMTETMPIYETYENEYGFEVSARLNCYGKCSTIGYDGIESLEDGMRKMGIIFLPGGFKVYGSGKTEKRAKQVAAKKLVEFINFQREILKNVNFGHPGECVSMLNEMSQKKLIKKPEYELIETKDKTENGNPVWKCIVTIGELSDEDVGDNKQAAKNHAAMRMIYKLLKFDFYMPYFEGTDTDIRAEEFCKLISKLNKEMKI